MISLNEAARILDTDAKGVLLHAAWGRLKAYTHWRGVAHVEFGRWWPDRREFEPLDGCCLAGFLPLTMETVEYLLSDGEADVTELAIWNTDAAQRALAVGGDAEYVRQRIIFPPGALKPAAHNRIPGGSDSLSVTPNDVYFKTADIEALQADCRVTSHAISSGAPESEEPPTPAAAALSKDGQRGLTKSEMLANDWPIPTSINLNRLLSDVPVWLEPARLNRGAPGKGSALWNPAMLALCLATNKAISKTALTRYITKYMPDWADEWERLSESL